MIVSGVVKLDRRFITLTDREWADADIEAIASHRGKLGWADLLTKPRVVVLAEAGSGKSTELKEHARIQRAEGHFAFYASVQDIGREGLKAALGHAATASLAAWRASDRPGWFFIDSVDEGKWTNVRLDTALRKLSDSLGDGARRAHVVLSSRYSDWDFTTDLRTFEEWLPVLPAEPLPPPPTPEELLVTVLRNESIPQPPKPEPAQVFVMAPLDRPRVHDYAVAKGAPRPDAFVAAVETSNLWQFARRPLDLGWMVEFWRANGRLGTLAEMVERSLAERLQETNAVYGRQDPLDESRCWRAVERIGAALVFGRASTVTIPSDDPRIAPPAGALDLARVLPDWSPEHRGRLLGRPVFDPATFGRVRLHNDNKGAVRGYLAARWLRRLKEESCPQYTIHDLLFANVYGHELIKDSARETAAWLSLWDDTVIAEILARDPFVLMTRGDPASLGVQTRAKALEGVASWIVEHPGEARFFENDSLRRFATPDMAGLVRTLWGRHKSNTEVRQLLLRMIYLGRLVPCVDIAVESAFALDNDEPAQVFAVRTLIDLADDTVKRRLAEYIRTEAPRLPSLMVWDAVEALLPTYLSVGDLMTLIDTVADESGHSLRRQGSALAARLERVEDLEAFISALLTRSQTEERVDENVLDPSANVFVPALVIAALRLLRRSPEGIAPEAVIDAVLELESDRYSRRGREKEEHELIGELQRTSGRRRALFWRAAARLSGSKRLHGALITEPFQMEILGWPRGLELIDLDWLLVDGPERKEQHERVLAVSAALQISQENGSENGVPERIEAAAKADAVMAAAFLERTTVQQESDETRENRHELEAAGRRHAQQEADRNASWQNFIAEMQADPEQIRRVPPPTEASADRRLFDLWRLASNTCGGGNRYGIDDLSPIKPVFGPALTAAMRDALAAFWRAWNPQVKSCRAPDKRNQISSLDCMGIAGVSLEAATNPDWAASLGFEEAAQVARYATLELNGFPDWLASVAPAWPDAVRQVLTTEISSEVTDSDLERHPEVLRDVARADPVIVELIAPSLFARLQAHEALQPTLLQVILEILVRGLTTERPALCRLALCRAENQADLETAAQYLTAAFAIDPAAATDALSARLDRLTPAQQTGLAQHVLPRLFGDGFSRPETPPVSLPFDVLERLVRVTFRVVRVEDDNDRRSGVVFSPTSRDDAERARDRVFNQLTNTPGRATYDALLRLVTVPGFPISAHRLRALAIERATRDAEGAPWPPGEAHRFEQSFEHAPTTPAELQLVALRRLEGIQHALLHGDFAQGTTVKSLPDECAVQNWVADRLRQQQGRAYSVEREPHVADETEPDIRLRAKASDASLAIEIKVAESWTLPQLEEALVEQLCGRYLRAADAHHGVLLLVHQRTRTRGWQDKTGAMLNFAEVVAYLNSLADTIAGATSNAPQPVVTVLDVSSCTRGKVSVRT